MARTCTGLVRRLLAAAIAASWLCAAGAAASAEGEPSDFTAAAVFAPRAPASLRSVDGGVRLWIVQALRRSGIPVVDPRHADELATRRLGKQRLHLTGEDAGVLAAQAEARSVLLTRLRVRDGGVEVWIRAYDREGTVIGVGHGESRLAALGDAVVAAFDPVCRALGGEPDAREVAPRLAELGRYERASDRLAEGALHAAWRELAMLQTATADAFREDIVAWSAMANVSGPERSRLASARGSSDPDWLAIRHALQRERTAEVLLAGAEHAAAGSDPAGALVLFTEVAKLDGKNLDAARGRARALSALGRQDDANAAYARVLELAPDDVDARVALAESPGLPAADQARLWLEAGALQSEQLDDAGARSSFERALAADGQLRSETRRSVARLEEMLGNDAEALVAWQEASSLDASNVEALGGVGRLRLRGGDAAGAATAFEKVLAEQPEDAAALTGYGDALIAQGRAEEAVAVLERAVALRPRAAPPRTSLARALTTTGRTDEALRILDSEQVPVEDRPELLRESAELHAAAGRLPEAQAALERAVAIEPDEAPLRSALAKVHTAAGHSEAAAQARAMEVALSGARAVATTERSAGAGSSATAPTGDEFASLAGTFPAATPERTPIRRVVWVGLDPVRDWRSELGRWLLPRSVDTAALEASLRAAFAERYEVEGLPEALPPELVLSLQALREFGTERADVALVNDLLQSDAALVARFAPTETGALLAVPGGAIAVEVRLASGRVTGDITIVGNQARLESTARYLRWNPRAAVVLAVLLAALAIPVLRGWGSLEVVLDYENTRGAQGFFSIELSRRPGRTKQERSQGSGRNRATLYQRRSRPWLRFTRHMVGRETRMRWLPARQWYVAVHGLLQDTASREVIGNYLEERRVRIPRGETVRVSFDFRRRAAPIEVKLHVAEGASAPAARVAVLGLRDSLRFAKDGSATVFVPLGKHTILIAIEDRVWERRVEVREMVGRVVDVAVDGDEGLLFRGCREAADAYLSGDLGGAGRALEAAGLREAAALVRAADHRLRGQAEEAAHCLEQAGRFAEAAELSKQTPAPKRSADLFEKAGEFQKAAEEHARAGDALQAARAYEAAFDYAAAIEAYRRAGAGKKLLELLEKTGRFYEAGVSALEEGDSDRALRCFQQVGPREPEYADACDALARLFCERSAFDLAVEKAREAIEERGGDDAPLESQEAFAALLERVGRNDEALSVWENIRKHDFQYAGASEKVNALRRSVPQTSETATAPSPAEPVATAPPAASRYEVLGEIGRGGMGVVLRARDTRLGRVVALKRMPENLKSHPTAVELFLREARAAASLSHPNIVTLFDADQEPDGGYYLTMELLEGFGLDSVLQKRGRLSPRDTLRIGIQIAKGLQYAHEKGVVHRDIKTANLFFTRDRVVKIMDFGLAKMTEEVRRAATVIGGTPYYMAPEQAAGEKVDHRADLYAFGVTLFELATGRVPFPDGDVTYQHRHTPAPDPRSLAPDVPDALALLIGKLMEKDPARRPAHSAEVVRALEQILAELGEGVSGPAARG